MKIYTTLITIAFVSFSLNSFSQITKGNWLVGGSGTFSFEKQKLPNQEDIKYTALSIAPDIDFR